MTTTAFPRYFFIAGHWVNSYQVLLCVGIYVGSLTTALVAQWAGLSPLALGLTAAMCALSGLLGARLYHVLVNASIYFAPAHRHLLWNRQRGGWSIFGALITFVPASALSIWMLQLPAALVWDCMSAGVLTGGFFIRMGCVFNGCCVGRETTLPVGVWLHDTYGVKKHRLPVQYLEMAWWLLGGALFLWLWPSRFAPGTYALGVLAFYGLGRIVLEPMREHMDRVSGIPVNQLVAALLALSAGGTIAIRAWLFGL